jgi:hypothetical protein
MEPTQYPIERILGALSLAILRPERDAYDLSPFNAVWRVVITRVRDGFQIFELAFIEFKHMLIGLS